MAKLNFRERLIQTGRNDPCPCGSGLKYKKCHLVKDEAAQVKEDQKKAEEAKEAAKNDADKKDKNEDKNVSKHEEKSSRSKFYHAPKAKMSKQDRMTSSHRKTPS